MLFQMVIIHYTNHNVLQLSNMNVFCRIPYLQHLKAGLYYLRVIINFHHNMSSKHTCFSYGKFTAIRWKTT